MNDLLAMLAMPLGEMLEEARKKEQQEPQQESAENNLNDIIPLIFSNNGIQ